MHTPGESPHGGKPVGRERAGTAEPATLVDLDGAVTRIAPSSTWWREQIRHPGDEPLFITRLERGQLWHRAADQAKTWAHEVQVGPATVVSERGRFHVVAEPDGGATITCLDGQVAVATQLTAALLLERDEAVSIAADGETCVVVEPPQSTAIEPVAVNGSPWRAPRRGLKADALRVWAAVVSQPYLVTILLVLVAILIVVLIVLLVFDRGSASGMSVGAMSRARCHADATREAVRAARWIRHP